MTQYDESALESDLTEIFDASVTASNVRIDESDGLRLSIADIVYYQRSGSDSTDRTRIRQTVMLLSDKELDLPIFSLHPTPRGVGGMLFNLIGDMGDINFEDSPEFSEAYQLFGWSEQPVRILFTPAVRDFFAKQTDWSVKGKGRNLVVYKQRRNIPENERDAFLQSGLQIMGLFQDAEQELDARPDVSRKATPQDMVQSLDRMGGLVGALAGSSIKRQLEQLSVSPEEMQTFQRSSPPRTIPSGLKRQVVGDNLPLVFVGLLFFFAGLIIGPVAIAAGNGPEKFVGVPFLIFFPLIGGGISFFTLRHRKRKSRVLTHGELVKGTIQSVSRTNTSINNQTRYSVRASVAHSSQEVEIYAYGEQVDLARQFQESGEPVDVLIDPQDSSHAVCLSLMMVFHSE